MADFAEINAILGRFTSDINTDLDKIMKDVANEAANMLKADAPVDSGKYKKGFKVDHEKGRYIIKNKQYQLTHLLEKGHDVVVNGKKVGHAKAYPHWKKADEYVEEQMTKRVEEIFK